MPTLFNQDDLFISFNSFNLLANFPISLKIQNTTYD
jgi:hypothetical protein